MDLQASKVSRINLLTPRDFAHLLHISRICYEVPNGNAQHTTRDPAPSTLNWGHALEASHARDELVGLALVVALGLHEQLRVLQVGGDPLKVGKVGHRHRRDGATRRTMCVELAVS